MLSCDSFIVIISTLHASQNADARPNLGPRTLLSKRIWDRRYGRELRRHSLAVRLIRHEARTPSLSGAVGRCAGFGRSIARMALINKIRARLVASGPTSASTQHFSGERRRGALPVARSSASASHALRLPKHLASVAKSDSYC